jgi:hypothetical protein
VLATRTRLRFEDRMDRRRSFAGARVEPVAVNSDDRSLRPRDGARAHTSASDVTISTAQQSVREAVASAGSVISTWRSCAGYGRMFVCDVHTARPEDGDDQRAEADPSGRSSSDLDPCSIVDSVLAASMPRSTCRGRRSRDVVVAASMRAGEAGSACSERDDRWP